MMTCNEMEAEMLRLKSVPCMDCIAEGRDGIWPVCAMQFDHVPERGPKVGTVRSCIKIGNEDGFRAEIAKCDVVCSNHHAIRSVNRPRTPENIRNMSEAQKIAQNNPENKAKKSAAIRLGMAASKQKPGQVQRMTDRWKDPEFRKKQRETRMKTESRKRMNRLRKFPRREWMEMLIGKAT